MPVPDTIWTNDVTEARAFIGRLGGQAVAKSVATAWWEEEGEGHFVYAQLVAAADLPAGRRLAGAPVCFQQAIWPKQDIRVTVAGQTVLAAVRSESDTEERVHLDWRRGDQGEWTRYELPEPVARRCRALVGALGLRFSGIDLALDEDGRLWFLELNPNGEWGWLQRSGLPIAEALADVLVPAASEKRARIPAGVQSVLLSATLWRVAPTPATWYLNRERVQEPLPMPSLPDAAWTRIERRALLARADERLRNLEAKGPGLATVSTVLTAGVVAAIATGWSESALLGRLILALAAVYVFLSLLVPLYLVGPMRRNVIHVNELVEAASAAAPEETLAEHAADAAMHTDLENLRIGNLLDAARRELVYALVLLAAWLMLVPFTAVLKKDHDARATHKQAHAHQASSRSTGTTATPNTGSTPRHAARRQLGTTPVRTGRPERATTGSGAHVPSGP